jgi:phosphotransferase system HPr-like phosphotransfer protein
MEAEKTPAFLYEKNCRVTELTGLCGRPSCWIALATAKSFGSAGIGKVFIRRTEDKKIADPFSIMSIMMLAAFHGAELVVYTNDPGLVEKVDALAEFINTVDLHTRVDLSAEEYSSILAARRIRDSV